MDFASLFRSATQCGPYDYQRRLACGERTQRTEDDWLSGGCDCESRLIDIPTGLGKTAAVVLAWLWNRLQKEEGRGEREEGERAWPRRLVYCLPMRTLVEQTEGEVAKWLYRLALAATEPDSAPHKQIKEFLAKEEQTDVSRTVYGNDWSEEGMLAGALSNEALSDLLWLVGGELLPSSFSLLPSSRSPIVLMGGEDLDPAKKEWDIYPEKPCIVIGTQDMLLSRALNRGYGLSRYRWPMHFGLLNNDCLWVLDEVQLMGVGIETTAQLQGLRERLGILRPVHTWWMSATLDAEQLGTIDFAKRASEGLHQLALSEKERLQPVIVQRIGATKSLEKAALYPASGKAADLDSYCGEFAAFVMEKHRQGTLSLVVVNRVHRAQEIAETLRKQKSDTPIALIHSRFRQWDRRKQEDWLKASGDRIVVATQAVEAGVDVSAATLITEIAPWPSLIQRFGRCNRYGECDEGGRIYWIDLNPEDEKDSRVLPYEYDDLKAARQLLEQCSSASPRDLAEIPYQPKSEIRPVIRRKDLIELFDTTPDLSGNDLDISRYVRDAEAADVQVYWREFDPAKEEPSENWAVPLRHELCRVSYGAFLNFAKKQPVFRWNPLEEEWRNVKQGLIPGGVYLLPLAAGGYRSDLGWTANSKHQLKPVEIPSHAEEKEADAYGRDPASFVGKWIRLSDHLREVEKTVDEITLSVSLDAALAEPLQTAARWHDLGKAHEVFQNVLRSSGEPPNGDELWAKSQRRGKPPPPCRRGFRHELASALAWLQAGEPDDLVAFLIATHHGKVRLSLRSMPMEDEPEESGRLFARGIWDGDELPAVALPNGETVGPLKLDLSCMQLGDSNNGPSWLSRMIRLRDRHGPFSLALLETLLRSADARASSPGTDLSTS